MNSGDYLRNNLSIDLSVFDTFKNILFVFLIFSLSMIFFYIIYLLFKRKNGNDDAKQLRKKQSQSDKNIEIGSSIDLISKREIGPNTLLQVLKSSKDQTEDDSIRYSKICEKLNHTNRPIRKENLIIDPNDASSLISFQTIKIPGLKPGLSATDPLLGIIKSSDLKTNVQSETIIDNETKTDEIKDHLSPKDDLDEKLQEVQSNLNSSLSVTSRLSDEPTEPNESTKTIQTDSSIKKPKKTVKFKDKDEIIDRSQDDYVINYMDTDRDEDTLFSIKTYKTKLDKSAESLNLFNKDNSDSSLISVAKEKIELNPTDSLTRTMIKRIKPGRLRVKTNPILKSYVDDDDEIANSFSGVSISSQKGSSIKSVLSVPSMSKSNSKLIDKSQPKTKK